MSRFTINQWAYTNGEMEAMLEEMRQSADWSSPNKMWHAVLWQALREAKYTTAPSAKRSWMRESARRWIFHGGRDFTLVCKMAGVDPQGFQTGARRRLGIE